MCVCVRSFMDISWIYILHLSADSERREDGNGGNFRGCVMRDIDAESERDRCMRVDVCVSLDVEAVDVNRLMYFNGKILLSPAVRTGQSSYFSNFFFFFLSRPLGLDIFVHFFAPSVFGFAD